jgi:exopolysaccharide biosynthesis polyprenyl glycosylphosphotransferase
MTTEMQHIPALSLSAPSTLAPRARTAVDAGAEANALVEPAETLHRVVPVAPAPLELVTVPDESDATVADATARAPSRFGENRLLRVRLVELDLLAVGISWILLGFVLVSAPTILERLAPGVAAGAVTLVAMRLIGLYQSRLCVRSAGEVWRIAVCALAGAGGFLATQAQVSSLGPEVAICAGCFVAVAATFRWQFARWLRARRGDGRFLRGVLLVGANHDAVQLRTMLRSEPELGYAVTGVIGEGHDDPVWADLAGSESLADIPALSAGTGASGILIVPYAVSSDTTQRAIAIASASNLHVQVWPGFRGVGSRRLRNVSISGEPFFYVEPSQAARWQLAIKRTLDIAGAGAVLILTAPLIAVSALLVKLGDRGPVFHRSERIGRHGKTICVYKIRSMSVQDEPESTTLASLNERTDGPLFKASKDPRVTKVGRFLRASSIDELPQLWNVLKGTMSLVGPRPALPSEVAQFDEELQRRHAVRPGITGLWQVEARHNPSFNAYRRLDLSYVDNWSLWLDARIILTTIPSILSQAYRAFLRSRRA